jgi:hypothetical protein
MEIDVKKTNPTPKDRWEAIRMMTDAQQKLVEAIFKMESFINDDEKENVDWHRMTMNEFVKQFKP